MSFELARATLTLPKMQEIATHPSIRQSRARQAMGQNRFRYSSGVRRCQGHAHRLGMLWASGLKAHVAVRDNPVLMVAEMSQIADGPLGKEGRIDRPFTFAEVLRYLSCCEANWKGLRDCGR